VVISVVFKVFGIGSILQENGTDLDLQALLLMSAIIGFTGSFISLAMSKWSTKRAMGVRVIDQPSGDTERWLVDTISRQAQMAGIGVPEVGIFDSPDPNAFATGMNRNKALVAVSTGLLQAMQADEIEAVLGHEISHIANGDMITMGLIQGVVNTFVIFLSRDHRVLHRSRRVQDPTRYRAGVFHQFDRGADLSVVPRVDDRHVVLAPPGI